MQLLILLPWKFLLPHTRQSKFVIRKEALFCRKKILESVHKPYLFMCTKKWSFTSFKKNKVRFCCFWVDLPHVFCQSFHCRFYKAALSFWQVLLSDCSQRKDVPKWNLLFTTDNHHKGDDLEISSQILLANQTQSREIPGRDHLCSPLCSIVLRMQEMCCKISYLNLLR